MVKRPYMFIIYNYWLMLIGSCEVSNCLRCQLLNSSCCTECELGYEINGCECEAASMCKSFVFVYKHVPFPPLSYDLYESVSSSLESSVTNLPSTETPQLLSLTLMIVAPVLFVLALCVCIIIVFVIVIIVRRRNRKKKLVNLDLRCVG